MIKAKLLSVLFLLAGISAIAQTNYDASLIPKELLRYASAVVRNEEITTEVKDLDNVSYHVKRVITVLNPNGDDIAHMAIYYNKSIAIKYIKGIAINEFGKVIAKFSERDFEDVSAAGNSDLFEEYRVKHYIPSITQYPYTIDYEYEIRDKQSLSLENWYPVSDYGLAVEKSSYQMICKPDFAIRYKQFNLPATVSIGTTKEGMKSYTWQISHVLARKDESLSVDGRHTLPSVVFAPEKFSFYGYNGAFQNWSDLGKWMYDNLLKNRTALPEETKQYIKSITADIADPKLKAKKVYEYMQQKTHYISIQIGIGGWQPFLASDVDRQGYGDCKALVNYTQSLLLAAGIDSWYCVVYGDHKQKRSLIADFASLQGNHVILCLPFKNDTTWLECTSQNIPFGYLGDFTDDRNVLACIPEGGKLLHTPKYTTEQNRVTRKADFSLSETGDLTGEISTSFKGVNYEDRYLIVAKAPAERLKDFKWYYPINNIDIKTLEYKEDKSLDPTTFEYVKLSAREYAALTDGKLLFSLNTVDHLSSGYKPINNRINPVTINHGHTYEDKVTYTLPVGWKLDSEPLNVEINKPFGSFSASLTIKDNQLIYLRKLQVKDGTYDKEVYGDIVDFYDAVIDADNYNVILVKK